MQNIILASGSPRRKQLLEKIGIEFKVDPSDFDEDMSVEMEPRELVKNFSQEKARDVAVKYDNAIIIAADTIVSFKDEIIGKPEDREDAEKIISKLNGRTHLVLTGYTIYDSRSEKEITEVVESSVRFRKLTQEEIVSYVQTGEADDKAGAYGIQALGSMLVERIEGDYYNIVGLPICSLVQALKEFGVSVL